MLRPVALALVTSGGLAGCGFAGVASDHPDAAPDAAVLTDGASTTTDAPACRDVLDTHVCPATGPSGGLAIAVDTVFDTDAGTTTPAIAGLACAATTDPIAACVVVATSVQITAGATLAMTGSRPVILFATGAVDLEGTLSVASRGTVLGAGANAAPCAAAIPPIAGSAGGGAGGSLGTSGAVGGGTALGTSAGGTPGAAQDGVAFRGGCAGGDGDGVAGGGGSSGGAVAVLADQITIAGGIVASGIGGKGGTKGHGGGGGGSGGLIVVDGSVVTVTAAGYLVANGGGGGGGGANKTAGGKGMISNRPAVRATGGIAGDASAAMPNAGGDGYSSVGGAPTDALPGVAAATPPDGGGGGGGGAGVIVVQGATLMNQGKSSPLAVLVAP